MPDAESRADRKRITADPASDSTPEASRPPDCSAAEGDPGLSSRSVSIHRDQSLALRRSNALVTRGLRDIGQLGTKPDKESLDLDTDLELKPDEMLELRPEHEREGVECLLRGEHYLDDEGDYDNAIVSFTEAIRLLPEEADAYFNRGSAYAAKDEWDQAIADFTAAIQLESVEPDAYLDVRWLDVGFCSRQAYIRRGEAHLAKDDYDKAIADFTEAIRLYPKDAEVYYERGEAYLAKDDYDKAVADFTEAIQIEPRIESKCLAAIGFWERDGGYGIYRGRLT